jgi:asparaginyl-tRNA synthetase
MPFSVTTLKAGETDYTKDFFGKKTYLTVSGQLHLKSLVVGGLSKAWSMTTAFRAEPSSTRMHLAEFWMLESEFCFGDLTDCMSLSESCIKYCFQKVIERCSSELEYLQAKYDTDIIKTIKKYITQDYIIMTHEECVEKMLKDIKLGKVTIDPSKKTDDVYIFKEIPQYDDDLTKDHERYVTEVLQEQLPVFIKWYPAKVKAFYMPKLKQEQSEIERSDCFDLIFPSIGEVVGGSVRESDYDILITQMKEKGIDPSKLTFYSDLRKYGSVPHCGFGIGFDRLLLILCGGKVHTIKDMVPFPRAYETCLY